MKFDEYLGGSDVEVVDGHLNTGDLGHLDQAGRLYIAGREDDMIVSGGENVFATEVENVLAHHPAIADVGVIGVPDNEFGQRLRAYIQPRDDVAAPTPDEVKAFVRERLERYKTPRDVVFVNSLPRNPTGKLLRSRLHQFDETTTPSAAPPDSPPEANLNDTPLPQKWPDKFEQRHTQPLARFFGRITSPKMLRNHDQLTEAVRARWW
ncbi:AMP-binding enzyme family protein [Mycobacterium xenopi 3993]|nr:AMP-binding enzyme family protein [Mycobacterium xenopi 3993]